MTDDILTLLMDERHKLNRAIEALQRRTLAGKTDDNPPEWVTGKSPTAAPQKRKMTAAGRRAIREGVRKRWAAINAAKAEAAPKKKTTKAIIAEAVEPKEDAEFKARMSAAMKKAWAKRKRAATKKTNK